MSELPWTSEKLKKLEEAMLLRFAEDRKIKKAMLLLYWSHLASEKSKKLEVCALGLQRSKRNSKM